MKKKNLLTAAASLALVAVIGVGATLAYFTDKTDVKTNVFTTGNVNITLVDETEGPQVGDQWTVDTTRPDGITYNNIMPGDTLSKEVAVTIDEMSSDCYVAVQVTVLGDTDLSDIVNQIETKAENNGWLVYVSDNMLRCYYPTALVAGSNESAALLFTEIDVPATWGNEYANTSFDVVVDAAAVQTANLDAPNETLDSSSVLELDKLLDNGAAFLG